MGPVTMILSGLPITHNTVKSAVANIPTERRTLDLKEVMQTKGVALPHLVPETVDTVYRYSPSFAQFCCLQCVKLSGPPPKTKKILNSYYSYYGFYE